MSGERSFRRLLRGEAAWLIGGSTYIFALRLIGALTVYVTQILFARWMGASELGHYVLATSWAIILAQLASLGYQSAALRFVPQSAAAGAFGRIAGFVRASRRTVMATALTVFVGAEATTLVIDRLSPLAARETLLLAYCAIPLLALVTVNGGIARSLSRIALAFLPNLVCRPVIILAAAAVVVATGHALSATRVVAIFIATVASIAVVQHLFVERRVKAEVSGAEPVYETRLWLRTALPLLLIGFFTGFFSQISIITAGVFLPADEIAVYNASLRTANIISFGLLAVGAMVLPRVSRLWAEQDMAALQRLVARAAQLRFWPTVLAVLALVFLGRTVLGLFGERFVAGYPALLIVAFTQLVIASVGLVVPLLSISGHQNRCLFVFTCALATALVLNAILVPRFGMEGGAVAGLGTALLWTIWLYRLVVRHLGLDPSILSFRHVFRRAPAPHWVPPRRGRPEAIPPRGRAGDA